jgi:hypothetical protein
VVRIGSAVEAADGDAGTGARVLVDPRRRLVTRLVVRAGHQLHHDVVVDAGPGALARDAR